MGDCRLWYEPSFADGYFPTFRPLLQTVDGGVENSPLLGGGGSEYGGRDYPQLSGWAAHSRKDTVLRRNGYVETAGSEFHGGIS